MSKRARVRVKEAAKYLGLAVVTLEADRSTGRLGIPFYRIGRACLYDLDELDEWFAKHRAPRIRHGEERAKRALAMVQEGKTLREVGELLGVSRQRAHQIIKEARAGGRYKGSMRRAA